MTKIIFIRHGATEWNREKRYLSFTDIDLNHQGVRQAQRLYRRLSAENITQVYSSDLKRAFNFAKIVFKESIIERSPELREVNFGIFEGLTHSHLIKEYPQLYSRWLNDPFGVTIPLGSYLFDFRKKLREYLQKIICLNKNRTLAVVTHAGPIKTIISDILKSKDIWGIKVDLASINIIEYGKIKSEITLLNDTSYLISR